MQHGDDLGQGIDREPEPHYMRAAAQPRPHLIQLKVREVEGAKETIMQRRAVGASPRQPGGDGGVPMPKHPSGGSD